MTTKGIKTVGKMFTKPNKVSDGGGLSALLIPRQVNAAGASLIVGGTLLANMADTGIKTKNRAAMGRVSYSNGMARMTNSFTSGGVQAMHRASRGNPAVFSDMAEEVLKSDNLMGKIETYGATPELISALYGMGG